MTIATSQPDAKSHSEGPSRPIPPGPAFRLGHRPSLDGLRGIAVLAVMVHHSGIPHTRGGYLGVDIFFVLSGFLITTLLLQEWRDRGAISLKNFYARRALRLLPALFTFLTGFFFYSLLSHRADLGQAMKSLGFALFYMANWARAFYGVEIMGRLNHTWSLSIEEQFYLLWPLLLIAMLKSGMAGRRLWAVLVMGIVASAGARAAMWAGGATIHRLYNGLDTRADALLVGCSVSVLVFYGLLPSTRPARLAIRGLSLGAALLLAFLVFRTTWETRHLYAGGLTLIAASAGLIIVDQVHAPSPYLKRILEAPPLAWVGRISYGLYLWHILCNAVVRENLNLPDPARWALMFGSTFAVASLSFYLIERPCLRIKQRFSPESQPVAAQGVGDDLSKCGALTVSG